MPADVIFRERTGFPVKTAVSIIPAVELTLKAVDVGVSSVVYREAHPDGSLRHERIPDKQGNAGGSDPAGG